MTSALPQLLTPSELANLLKVSPHTVRAMVRKKKLFPVRICRRLLFDPGEVARMLAEAK
jgi:excisionase family DNA binding protein